MTYLPTPPVAPATEPVRRSWWRRIGRAAFIWVLETLIGLIPLIAHEASAALEPSSAHAGVGSVLPEICVLTVIASALALLGLLRDLFFGDAIRVTSWTIVLAFANGVMCVAPTFLYPYAVHETLTGRALDIPWYMLAIALVASFTLAGERGYNSRH